MERKDLLDSLVAKNLTLSSMESLTGGLFASTFTSIPGASQVYKGSAVTYTDKVKALFGVSEKTLEAYGAISKECAKEMALQCSLYFDTDCAVSFTGNAGPDAQEDKPVGLVYIGVKVKNQLSVYELHLAGERNFIRRQCVDFAFKTLYEKISALD